MFIEQFGFFTRFGFFQAWFGFFSWDVWQPWSTPGSQTCGLPATTRGDLCATHDAFWEFWNY